MPRTTTRRLAGTVAAAITATGLLGTGILGTGTASAETVAPLDRCWGISPNIVDQPYSTARLFVSPDGPGRVTAAVRDISSFWRGGYESVGRLDWHNLRTGKRGTAVDAAPIRLYVNGPTFRLNTGTGPVRVTLSAVNRNALWSIPTTSCSGTLQVR
ncbi:hypothetical protein [Gordonia sp. NB41Y]|uniref:hypothetical protein n=1 Tax=Gordonia sp. NB41Y TaxID=875808 RepID=UPI0006B144C9|nr:hypothetical protein [Gordonia sp. NB41Y]KOY49176.1 hypothetical protein ISGA_11865 [Gordonia sp. NB41Y]WLP89467.1 hypothetical protein Q9K23_18050 [Gordonia sp. NB41Y]